MNAAIEVDPAPAVEVEETPWTLALADIERYDGAAAAAKAARDTATDELARVERNAGGDVLDAEDPAAAEDLATTMARLQATVSIQAKVAAEAERRAEAARTALLLAEADELEQEVDRARAELEAHRAKVATALERLKKISGMDWRSVNLQTLVDERRARGDFGPITWQRTQEEMLGEALDRLHRRQSFARLAAEDRAAGRLAMTGQARDDLPRAVRDGVVELNGLYWMDAPAQDGV